MAEYKPYFEKLKDPRWQKKRLEIMERDEFKCSHCGDDEKTLNVHHKFYRKGANPWDYPDDALMTLCEPCHEEIGAGIEELLAIVGGGSGLECVIGYAIGLHIRTEWPPYDDVCICLPHELTGFLDALYLPRWAKIDRQKCEDEVTLFGVVSGAKIEKIIKASWVVREKVPDKQEVIADTGCSYAGWWM